MAKTAFELATTHTAERFEELQDRLIGDINAIGVELSTLTKETFKSNDFVSILNRLTASYGEMVSAKSSVVAVSLVLTAAEIDAKGGRGHE